MSEKHPSTLDDRGENMNDRKRSIDEAANYRKATHAEYWTVGRAVAFFVVFGLMIGPLVVCGVILVATVAHIAITSGIGV